MNYINQPIIIFSVFQSHLSHGENLNNHKHTLVQLSRDNIGHKVVKGVYNGDSELSIIVDQKHVDHILRLAKTYNQESILFSDQSRNSELVYIKTGKREPLGILTNVKQDYAIAQGSYTFDSLTGQYWVTIPKIDVTI